MLNKKNLSKSIVVIMIILIINTNIVLANEADNNTQDINLAAQVVSNMGVGWNLGNTLDAYSLDQFSYKSAQQMKNLYQIMATYSTKYYSGWDASQVPYFESSTSSCKLNWKISKLNSGTNKACGYFAFQIINHGIKDSGTNTLDFTVTKAQFTTSNGKTVNLNDMLGDYSKTIQKDVTTYVVADLSKVSQLKTTSDVLGGTLTIEVKINNYPLPKNSSSLSKETYYETLWGNPVTTKEMIDMVKEEGFGAVRIPVTYYNHMDAQGNIDEEWLERVSELVQYVLDNDMYCIINMHHDTGKNGWLKADLSTIDTVGVKFENVWQQIGEYFKDYNQKLLFEGYNEILNSSNKWSWAGEDSYTAANKLNQIFVDTVRSTGGNNSERCLIVNTYAASTEEEVLNHFTLPNDSVENRLIVEAHYYGSSKNGIRVVMERLGTKFTNKGIPVIIGEFGTNWKMTETDRVSSANYFVTTAKQYKIACFWWDDGNYTNKIGAKCDYAILDRCSLTWYYPSIIQTLVNSLN